MLRPSAAATIGLFFFLCLLSKSTAQGNSSKCYELRNETVCYFQPADGVALNWDDADKFCRDNNATLPVILNSDHQRTIEEYLSQFPQRNVLVFTAGRKSWSLDPNYPWRWVNGKQALTSSNFAHRGGNFGCIDTNLRISLSAFDVCSSYRNPFICQYSESICQTLEKATYQLHDRSHCFVIYDDRFSWYDARNKCIEGGGDLAIFDDVDILIAVENYTLAIEKTNRYYIGLQSKWWTWRLTDLFDIKYTNWPQYVSDDVSGLDCVCLNGGDNFKWMSCNCSEGRPFLCQSEFEVSVHHENLEERSISNSQTDKFSNVSRCYDVNGNQVCYFTPENTTRLNFSSAIQWCGDHNATLPIIRTKDNRETLQSFLETISLPVYLLWASGLRIDTRVWSEINGQVLLDKIEDCIPYTNWDEKTKQYLVDENNCGCFCLDPWFHRSPVKREMVQYYICLCLETFTYKWTLCDCDKHFRFVCQRETFGSQGSEVNQALIFATVEGLIIAILIIAVVSLVIRLKKKSKIVANVESNVRDELDQGYASVNRTGDSISSEYQDIDDPYEQVH